MKTFRNDAPYIKYLIEKDPKLEVIFKHPEKIEFELSNDYFESLISAITFQQLSGRVAQTIYNRVVALLKGNIDPQSVLAADFDDLRACGLSARKISYYKSLAELVSSGQVHFQNINKMSNQEIIDMLTKIKGIGPWTAEMFLLFTLGRDDVFSVLDLGLRTALSKVYGRDLSKEEILVIAEKWSPYKSVVSHYLWHYLEQKPK